MTSAIVQEFNSSLPDPIPSQQSTFVSNTARQTATPPPTTLSETIARNALDIGVEPPRTHSVSFHYNTRVEQHHFGRHHPMKPWRLQLTKQLVMSYGLQYAMECHESQKATRQEMEEFHRGEYLEFLET